MQMDKIAKLLALALSAEDHESLAALRSVRRLLTRDGLDIKDLLDSGQTGHGSVDEVESLRRELQEARREIRQLKRKINSGVQAHNDEDREIQAKTIRDLRLKVRTHQIENGELCEQLDALREEAEFWRQAHQQTDETLRHSSIERRNLRVRLRRVEEERTKIISQVSGVISASEEIRVLLGGWEVASCNKIGVGLRRGG